MRRCPIRHGQSERDRIAARMREYHLTHGSGCKTRARAIEKRKGTR